MWMGDLETDFMEAIQHEVDLPKVDLLFAPHHGRKSGRVPTDWLDDLKPKVIIVGEAHSADLEYYDGYNTITQNTAGDIMFQCESRMIHVYVSSSKYSVGFLADKGRGSDGGLFYLGSLDI